LFFFNFAGITIGSANPVRARRSTQNGRSPLTLNSAEQRHVKYSSGQPGKVAATHTEIKSPPIAGNFTHAGAAGGVSNTLELVLNHVCAGVCLLRYCV